MLSSLLCLALSIMLLALYFMHRPRLDARAELCSAHCSKVSPRKYRGCGRVAAALPGDAHTVPFRVRTSHNNTIRTLERSLLAAGTDGYADTKSGTTRECAVRVLVRFTEIRGKNQFSLESVLFTSLCVLVPGTYARLQQRVLVMRKAALGLHHEDTHRSAMDVYSRRRAHVAASGNQVDYLAMAKAIEVCLEMLERAAGQVSGALTPCTMSPPPATLHQARTTTRHPPPQLRHIPRTAITSTAMSIPTTTHCPPLQRHITSTAMSITTTIMRALHKSRHRKHQLLLLRFQWP